MQDVRLPGGEALGEDPPWDPWTPLEVADRLAGSALRWYVVAGWAIDLFLGVQTRDHEDIEIGVPEAEFPLVRAALDGFEFDVVGSGERWPIGNAAAVETHFQTWVREPTTGVYRLDVFRDPHDGATWLCRRDPSIRMPFDELVRRSAEGVPYMAPEVVLLFKAKHDRDKDRRDLKAVLPSLSDAQARWLKESLSHLHPGHPWITEVL